MEFKLNEIDGPEITDSLAIEKFNNIKLSIEEQGVSRSDVDVLDTIIGDNYISSNFNKNKLTTNRSKHGASEIINLLNKVKVSNEAVVFEKMYTVRDIAKMSTFIIFAITRLHTELKNINSNPDILSALNNVVESNTYCYRYNQDSTEQHTQNINEIPLAEVFSERDVSLLGTMVKVDGHDMEEAMSKVPTKEVMAFSILLNAISDTTQSCSLDKLLRYDYRDTKVLTISRAIKIITDVSTLKQLKILIDKLRIVHNDIQDFVSYNNSIRRTARIFEYLLSELDNHSFVSFKELVSLLRQSKI